jgi:hypothetical protein
MYGKEFIGDLTGDSFPYLIISHRNRHGATSWLQWGILEKRLVIYTVKPAEKVHAFFCFAPLPSALIYQIPAQVGC